MTITLQIDKLSRVEKLKAMEALWESLSMEKDDIESPAWHRDLLKETEARVAAGQERIADWEVATRELRKRFE